MADPLDEIHAEMCDADSCQLGHHVVIKEYVTVLVIARHVIDQKHATKSQSEPA